MKLFISRSPARRVPRSERTYVPVVYDYIVEHRRRGRIYDRHQSDEACEICSALEVKYGVVLPPFISDVYTDSTEGLLT